MSSEYGLLVLFGSGETGTVGRTIHRKVFQFLGKRDQRAAVLETPAGFQVIPARRRTTGLPRPAAGGARNNDFDFRTEGLRQLAISIKESPCRTARRLLFRRVRNELALKN